jgi:hypothetical protein
VRGASRAAVPDLQLADIMTLPANYGRLMFELTIGPVDAVITQLR